MIISLKLHTHKKFNGDSDHKNFPFEMIYTRMCNHWQSVSFSNRIFYQHVKPFTEAFSVILG